MAVQWQLYLIQTHTLSVHVSVAKIYFSVDLTSALGLGTENTELKLHRTFLDLQCATYRKFTDDLKLIFCCRKLIMCLCLRPSARVRGDFPFLSLPLSSTPWVKEPSVFVLCKEATTVTDLVNQKFDCLHVTADAGQVKRSLERKVTTTQSRTDFLFCNTSPKL